MKYYSQFNMRTYILLFMNHITYHNNSIDELPLFHTFLASLQLMSLLMMILFVHFRDIQEPKNVKLLFDVLRFEPPSIHRAVLFVTNNALVCETPEDASRVAYDLDRNKNTRYDVGIRYNYIFNFILQ